jgi:hypothetical protein
MNTDEIRWRVLQTALHEKQLEQAFALFRGAGIEPVLIKGWAALRFYPDEDKRYPGDLDLCVAPEDHSAAYEILKNDQSWLPVDLHKGLRHLDTVPFHELISHSKLVKLGETDIRVLRDEDHLRVLCVHWLNDGGAYREKLKDIHYAVENRERNFDWDRCLNAAGARRRRWVICAILLAHKYFGTKIDDTPAGGEKDLPLWLVGAVEKEWRDPVRLKPLELFLRDPQGFWQQLRKRMPPNALQATIEMEGDFDRLPRIYYQAIDTLARIIPSFRRIKTVIGTSAKN